jgi:hypothetical protein
MVGFLGPRLRPPHSAVQDIQPAAALRTAGWPSVAFCCNGALLKPNARAADAGRSLMPQRGAHLGASSASLLVHLLPRASSIPAGPPCMPLMPLVRYMALLRVLLMLYALHDDIHADLP